MPEEIHRHYDAEGTYTGHTVIEREAEWDDSARARAMRLDEYEQGIDAETGLPIDEAFRDQPFIVHHEVINYAARALDRERKRHTELHKDDSDWLVGRRFVVQKPTPAQVAEHLARLQEPSDPD